MESELNGSTQTNKANNKRVKNNSVLNLFLLYIDNTIIDKFNSTYVNARELSF